MFITLYRYDVNICRPEHSGQRTRGNADFPLFPVVPFWHGVLWQLQQHPLGIAPVAADIQFSMPPFTKQRGVEVCFNLHHGNGYCRRENLSQIMISPAPGTWTAAARFLIIECIELFLQPPAGWSLSHWLHQYILYGRQ